MKWQAQMLVVCIGGVAIAAIATQFATALSRQTPGSAQCSNLSCLVSKLQAPPTQLSLEQLRTFAQAITVKVFSREFLGSGILINRQGQVYTVVTNAHVLRAGNSPYQIQTPDQQIYPAVEILSATLLQGNDLALLQFRSIDVYAQATMGDSSTLKVGDEVFAGGFPSSSEVQTSFSGQFFLALREQLRFVFTSGQVSLLLDKALEGGYKIGYTNDIRKGMSGGPVLNSRGEVVGINGRHAEPLWDAPDLYQDGSHLDQSLQNIVNHFSWAVPMETIMHRLGSLAVVKNSHSQPQPELKLAASPITAVVKQKQQKALPLTLSLWVMTQ